LECLKPRLYAESGSEEKKLAASVVVAVLDGTFRLLHPLMPFVTEELWHRLPGKTGSIMKEAWPKSGDYPADEAAAKNFELIKEAVTAIRAIRGELSVSPAAEVVISFVGDDPEIYLTLKNNLKTLGLLARIDQTRFEHYLSRLPLSVAVPITGGDLCFLAEGYIDKKTEVAKLKVEMEKLEKYISLIMVKLSDDRFVKNAPESTVEAEKNKLQENQKRLIRTKELYEIFEQLPG